jgi:anti-anti-sigma regulatory factor
MTLKAKKHNFTENILNIPAQKQDFSACMSINREIIRLAMSGAKNIIINLESTASIDNTFVNMLLDSEKFCCKTGCTLSICGMSPDILCALYILKIDKRIELYENVNDALCRQNRLVRRNFRVV